MKNNDLKLQVASAVAACEDKKADRLSILELEKNSGAFTDYFIICSASNPRQLQAISDEVEEKLRKLGLRPKSVEGYRQAEWVLLDYVDFVVHVFSEKAREFYDLERLWKSAKRLTLEDVKKAAAPRAKQATTAKKTAKKAPAKKAATTKSVAKKRTAATPRKRARKP